MADLKVGKVAHYYDKIGVAVVDLSKKLAVGDRIKFVKEKVDLFEQEVVSMEFDHKKADSAKKGDCVGMKVDQPVKKGVEVYKIE